MRKYADPIHSFLVDSHLRWLRHTCLLILIIVMSIGICNSNIQENTPMHKVFFLTLIYAFTLGVSFYLNIFWGVKQLLVRNRLFHYLLFLLVLMVVDVFLVMGVMFTFFQNSELLLSKDMPLLIFFMHMFNSMVSIVLIVASFSTILLLRHWIMANERKSELVASTLQSELISLKKQINPHFLFNMLNNAHVLVKKKRPEASDVIFKLEDLLRYQMDDSSKEEVKLISDIRFLQDFLNLEKIRRDTFEFYIVREGNVEGIMIPPLLFIPFVENAVKYSQDSEHLSYVRLCFRVMNRKLHFECINSKPQKEIRKNATGGLGLKNIKRRLELLYPENHTLSITDQETLYSVKLTIEL